MDKDEQNETEARNAEPSPPVSSQRSSSSFHESVFDERVQPEISGEATVYLNSNAFYRRPSYLPSRDLQLQDGVPINNFHPANKILAGGAYALDPFTGNLVDGHEDSPVPEFILKRPPDEEIGQELRHSLHSSIHEQQENYLDNGNRQSNVNYLSASKRDRKIAQFYGNLTDPKARITLAWKDIRYSVKQSRSKNKPMKSQPQDHSNSSPRDKNASSSQSAQNAVTKSDQHSVTSLKSQPPLPENYKQILFGIDGQARPGELIGILGSSGAGKTTLLNILSGRMDSGELSGIVTVNGQKRGPDWRRMIGFVEQQDLLFSTLTVRENLEYSALLRLPRYLSKEHKLSQVDSIIRDLGLIKCENTRIGDENTRGVSGGERKRTSIGIELIANPRLIFLDEPTTGLDAFTSVQLMQCLNALSKNQGKTIIMTIHQPREEILFLFDKILLLSRGRTMYFGPTQGALDHFETLGFSCPMSKNPADFFMDLMSVEFQKKFKDSIRPTAINPHASRLDSESRVSFLLSAWEYKRKAELNRRGLLVNNSIKQSSHPATYCQENSTALSAVDKSANNFWITEMCILLHRYMIHQKRDHLLIISTIGQQFIMILLVSFTFFQLPLTQEGIQGRIGLLFFTVINAIIMVLQPILLSFPLEKQLIIKERWSSAYRNSSVYVAKALSLIPMRLVVTLIYGLSTYYINGLNPAADRYFFFQLILLTVVFNSQALGLALSASVSTVEIAQVVGPLVFLVILIYAGNFVGTTVPAVLAWLKYLSTGRYAYMSFMQNEFNGLTFLCSDNQPPVNDTCPGGGYATGEQVLDAFDLYELPIYTNLLILLGFMLAFHIMGMIALLITTKPRSKIL